MKQQTAKNLMYISKVLRSDAAHLFVYAAIILIVYIVLHYGLFVLAAIGAMWLGIIVGPLLILIAYGRSVWTRAKALKP